MSLGYPGNLSQQVQTEMLQKESTEQHFLEKCMPHALIDLLPHNAIFRSYNYLTHCMLVYKMAAIKFRLQHFEKCQFFTIYFKAL